MNEQTPDPFELEARFQAVLAQRNNAMNDAALLAGRLALAERDIAQLKAQLAAPANGAGPA
jgi:hypothetical protein